MNHYQLEKSLAKLFVALVFVSLITIPHILKAVADEMLGNSLSPEGRAALSYVINVPLCVHSHDRIDNNVLDVRFEPR
ncbi:hypothetical protein BD410DRAFT_793130 [Rickenella mellea]|uniref:Uncharacterized protein n=1 Tax=Rickenella mellea TaxID=50990 RepID=A0A4Y7PUP5_9AGAM|nr:hypothetical protein BD410DRAFT_793130 [Rickenella mellea]